MIKKIPANIWEYRYLLEHKKCRELFLSNSKKQVKITEIIGINEDLLIENDDLKEENDKLKEENERLKREIDSLTSQMNLNSSNSNWSSSNDRPWLKVKKRIYSSRPKTNLKVGGQLKHKGHFGTLCLNPDETIIHINEQPPRNGIIDLPNNKIITQVKEIEFKTKVIQHEYTFNDGTKVSGFAMLPNAYTYGNTVNAFISWLVNQGFVSFNRVGEFIRELTNSEIKISNSYIANSLRYFANKLKDVNIQLQKQVKDTDVLHLDETSVKLNGKLMTIQGYANKATTYLAISPTKCNETISTFLKDYHNWLVADYSIGYQKEESHCKFAGCNAHIDRYLKRMINDYKIPEATQMYELLHGLKDHAIKWEKVKIEKQYLTICNAYLEKHDKLNLIDRSYYHDAYLLFNRLKKKMHQHLAFAEYPEVPYTNNLIERDFRHAKTKMKISGTFRGYNNLVAFVITRSFIKTCIKRNINLWKATSQVWNGNFSL